MSDGLKCTGQDSMGRWRYSVNRPDCLAADLFAGDVTDLGFSHRDLLEANAEHLTNHAERKVWGQTDDFDPERTRARILRTVADFDAAFGTVTDAIETTGRDVTLLRERILGPGE